MSDFKKLVKTEKFQTALKKWHDAMRNRDYYAFSCNVLRDELENFGIYSCSVVLKEYHQFAINKGLADKKSHYYFAFLFPDNGFGKSNRQKLVDSFYNEHKIKESLLSRFKTWISK